MAWNGMPLNWSKIIYNNIKMELIQKQTKGPLALYSAIYLTKMMDPTQPTIPTLEMVNLTLPMEIETTSIAKKRKGNEAYCIRMKAQTTRGSSALQLESDEQEMAVNLVNASAEEVIQEVRQDVVQQLATSMTGLTKETELIQTLDIFSKKYTKLAGSKKRVEEKKVKLAAELEIRKSVVVNLTMELEELKEELQTYKKLPSTLKLRQLDNARMQEELCKTKVEYQEAIESLVRLTSLKRDLSQECVFKCKENEKLKVDVEKLRIKLHEACHTAELS